MYFFKSVLDASEADLQDGQILVRNTTGRLFRVSTAGFLVQANGLAVVESRDPIVQHNIKLKRIVVVQAESTPSAAPKKSRKKKAEQAAEEQTSVSSASEETTKPEDVAVEQTASEEAVSAPVESAPVEQAEAAPVEQSELAPNVDESSL